MAAKDSTRRETEEAARALIVWAAKLEIGDIPDPVLRKAALIVADNIAATVAARDEPEVRRVHGQLIAGGGRAEATVFRGGRPRTDRISAALANGIAGSWCELDEGYRLASCHAGLYTLPALLAEAEARDLALRDVLRAAVASYEVTARFARCWAFPQLTLHPHPQTAAIGGAAATGLARRFDAARLTDAVTAAATLVTVGDYQHAVDGALVRNVWAAVGTANGMRAADWAECGIGGKPDGPYAAYTTLLGQPPAPRHLTTGLGEEWAVTNGYHKIHACCQSTHSAVEATLMALERLPAGKTTHNVSRIVLETHRPGMSNPRPATTLAAKFSFEHVLATTQVHGHARAEAFAAETLTAPEVARLRERVELKPYDPVPPRPNDRPARLTLHFDDGATLTTECLSARGGPDRPFDEKVVLDKVEDIMRGVYPGFVPLARKVMALEPAQIADTWTHLLEAFTH